MQVHSDLNNIGLFHDVQHSLGLDPEAEFVVRALEAVGRSGRFPLRGIEAGVGDQPVCGPVSAISGRVELQPPFSQKRFPVFREICFDRCVDHAAAILCQLAMYELGRMVEQVEVLAHCAALN